MCSVHTTAYLYSHERAFAAEQMTNNQPSQTLNTHTHTPHFNAHIFSVIFHSTYSVVAQISTSPAQCVVLSTADSNGNHDSGYAAANVDETVAASSTPPASPHHSIDSGTIKNIGAGKRNGVDDSPKREPNRYVTRISVFAFDVKQMQICHISALTLFKAKPINVCANDIENISKIFAELNGFNAFQFSDMVCWMQHRSPDTIQRCQPIRAARKKTKRAHRHLGNVNNNFFNILFYSISFIFYELNWSVLMTH